MSVTQLIQTREPSFKPSYLNLGYKDPNGQWALKNLPFNGVSKYVEGDAGSIEELLHMQLIHVMEKWL